MNKKPVIIALLLFLVAPICFPSNAEASSFREKLICEITIETGEKIKCSLSSFKPKISGEDTLSETVKVSVNKKGEDKFLINKSTKVVNDTWKINSSKKFKAGDYEIKIIGLVDRKQKTELVGTLYVGKKSNQLAKVSSTLAVSPIPLLFGGVARAGNAVPVSYLQVTNIGKEALVLNGFNLMQNGTASVDVVSGFTLFDGTDAFLGSVENVSGPRGSALFKSNAAFFPAVVSFDPGQMRLFTIKAVITNNTGVLSQNFGKNLMLGLTSVDTNGSVRGVFPIRGVSWIISN